MPLKKLEYYLRRLLRIQAIGMCIGQLTLLRIQAIGMCIGQLTKEVDTRRL